MYPYTEWNAKYNKGAKKKTDEGAKPKKTLLILTATETKNHEKIPQDKKEKGGDDKKDGPVNTQNRKNYPKDCNKLLLKRKK